MSLWHTVTLYRLCISLIAVVQIAFLLHLLDKPISLPQYQGCLYVFTTSAARCLFLSSVLSFFETIELAFLRYSFVPAQQTYQMTVVPKSQLRL